MTSFGDIRVEAGIGVIAIDAPPVNVLSAEVREAIDGGLDQLMSRDDVTAIVILCEGKTFFAGADISEFGQPEKPPRLAGLFNKIEAASKPIVAAIHGTALGAGLELALVSHYRIAVPSAKLGFPEVKLGVLPGAGGTQRLPRLIGVERALEVITSGRNMTASEALETGLLDALVDAPLRPAAVAFARDHAAAKELPAPVRERETKLHAARERPEIFNEFLARNRDKFRGYPAPRSIVEAVRAAVQLPSSEGKAREWELFLALEASSESRALRYLFAAERLAARPTGIFPGTQEVPIGSVGVVGAGTMGTGIAINFLHVGLPVLLSDTSEEAVNRGIARIRKTLEAAAERGRLAGSVDDRMRLITPTVGLAGFGFVDLVIEAVFESLPIKQQVFAELDRIAHPAALLATNTSFLDIDAIAACTGRPESVLGLHFFSPANVMRLLEVVRGAKTSASAILSAMGLAKRIGKIAVICGVCDGFVANRAMKARAVQADAMLLEGTPMSDIDAALRHYGFVMGHFQTMDLVGLDVIGRDEAGLTVMGELVRLGRLGRKQVGGFYDYDDRGRATPSADAAKVIAEVAQKLGVSHAPTASMDEILARLLYPVVNECAKILEEGVAVRASDIDVAVVTGYNWPDYTGGPLHWADRVGLGTIVPALEKIAALQGPSNEPATLLRQMAAAGKRFSDA